MQALGLIETKGLIAAIESADAMLKAADVNLLEKTHVGGGLVSIAITGDVAAVKAAVEAGGAAVRNINSALLLSEHVIPRPHENLENVIISAIPIKDREILTDTSDDISSEEKVKVTQEDSIMISSVIEDVLTENTLIDNSMDEEFSKEEIRDSLKIDLSESYNKESVDKMVIEYGLDKTLDILSKFSVKILRKLAREYKDFSTIEKPVSKAHKKLLLENFRRYYKNR